MTLNGVLRLLKKNCAELGGQAAFARAAGEHKQIVSAVLGGQREPTDRVLAALGLERSPTEYRRVRDVVPMPAKKKEARRGK